MNKFVGRNRNNNVNNFELFTKYVILFTSVYIIQNIPFVNTTSSEYLQFSGFYFIFKYKHIRLNYFKRESKLYYFQHYFGIWSFAVELVHTYR